MRTTKSLCGRFVMLDGLHLDRKVFEALERWALERGIQVQDAIQLALCTFRDGVVEWSHPRDAPASSSRMAIRGRRADRIE